MTDFDVDALAKRLAVAVAKGVRDEYKRVTTIDLTALELLEPKDRIPIKGEIRKVRT